jgi:hypothetical protein
MRILIASAALTLAAAAAVPAQMPGAAAKAAAQKAVAATNAQIEAEQAPTREQTPQTKTPATPTKTQTAPQKKQAPTKTAPAKSVASKPTSQKGSTSAAGKKGAVATPAADTAGPPPTIWRESFVYEADHRRDPFNSLLTTNELRPTLSDLKITGILFDPAGRRSFATLRDLVTNAQYRVTNGSTLGRMRVAAIRTRIVVFTIDEFGTTRQDSLVFGDTTKARGK